MWSRLLTLDVIDQGRELSHKLFDFLDGKRSVVGLVALLVNASVVAVGVGMDEDDFVDSARRFYRQALDAYLKDRGTH